MFNLDVPEFLLLLAVALIILGPEKFPQYAKIALKTYRDIRNYFDEAKREIANELTPVKTELQQLTRYDPETYLNKLTEAVSEEPDTKETPTPFVDPYRDVTQPVDYPQGEAVITGDAQVEVHPGEDPPPQAEELPPAEPPAT